MQARRHKGENQSPSLGKGRYRQTGRQAEEMERQEATLSVRAGRHGCWHGRRHGRRQVAKQAGPVDGHDE
jgi:hypothetical protein